MPASPLVISCLVTVCALATAAHLLLGPTPHVPSAAALGGGGMLLLTIVAVTGLLIAHSRWSRPVIFIVTAASLGLSAVTELSPWSMAAIATAAATICGLLGPWLRSWIRRLAAVEGPPPSAVALLLVLVATPAAVGLALPDGPHPAVIAWAVWAPVLALGLARAVSGALAATRVGHPVLALAAGLVGGWPDAVAVGVMTVPVVVLAWQRELAVAVVPPLERRADPVPFPPELVDPAILAAAGLDDRGHPLKEDE